MRVARGKLRPCVANADDRAPIEGIDWKLAHPTTVHKTVPVLLAEPGGGAQLSFPVWAHVRALLFGLVDPVWPAKQAAIDPERLSRDKGGFVARQECYCAADVGRGTGAPQRRCCSPRFFVIRRFL